MNKLHYLHRSIDFIGIGAQKAGTSWIYACLYEHPEICMPFKEINFFSRERNWKKGLVWYKSRFKTCPENKLRGEFSTSYLDSKIAAKRIHDNFPHVKLIACLRNPIDRAFSNYKHDIKVGNISENISFDKALKEHKEYIRQGFYSEQLERYFKYFSKEQILILIYEDIKKNPFKFIQRIYRFLGVDDSFVPSMLEKKIDASRVSKFIFIDKLIRKIANLLRKIGLHKLVWVIKKTNIPEIIRKANTKKKIEIKFDEKTRNKLKGIFRKDVEKLSKTLKRDLTSEWLG